MLHDQFGLHSFLTHFLPMYAPTKGRWLPSGHWYGGSVHPFCRCEGLQPLNVWWSVDERPTIVADTRYLVVPLR